MSENKIYKAIKEIKELGLGNRQDIEQRIKIAVLAAGVAAIIAATPTTGYTGSANPPGNAFIQKKDGSGSVSVSVDSFGEVYSGQIRIGRARPDGSGDIQITNKNYEGTLKPHLNYSNNPQESSYRPGTTYQQEDGDNSQQNQESAPRYNIPQKNYNFKTAKQYIDAIKVAYKKDRYEEMIYLSEDAISRIANNKTLLYKDKDKSDLLHLRKVSYDLLERRGTQE